MTDEADWQALPHRLLCTVEFRMDGAMTVARSHALTVDIERRLRKPAAP